MNLLELMPKLLDDSDILESFVIVEPVVILVDEDTEGGDLNINEWFQFEKMLLQVFCCLDAVDD